MSHAILSNSFTEYSFYLKIHLCFKMGEKQRGCAVTAVSLSFSSNIGSCQNAKHKWTVRCTRDASRIFCYLEHNTQDHKQHSSRRDTPVDPLLLFPHTRATVPRDVTKRVSQEINTSVQGGYSWAIFFFFYNKMLQNIFFSFHNSYRWPSGLIAMQHTFTVNRTHISQLRLPWTF